MFDPAAIRRVGMSPEQQTAAIPMPRVDPAVKWITVVIKIRGCYCCVSCLSYRYDSRLFVLATGFRNRNE